MKKNKILVNILYRVFRLAFFATLMSIIVSFSFEIFTKKGEIENYSSVAHHSRGYEVPVTLNVKLPNAIFNYDEFEQTLYTESGEQINLIPEDFKQRTVNVLSFDDGEENVFTTTDSYFTGNSSIVVNSENLMLKILLGLRAYSGVIALAFSFYFLKKIFFSLKKELRFNLFLHKNVKFLGIVIVAKIILDLGASYIYNAYNFYLTSRTFVDGKFLDDRIWVSLSSRGNFEFLLFL
ncbi:hypothetical protein [Thalassobellus citreus]|uniref:hypothetical protein n=1 Tax=Thalassobellus citreus TaxID=3367752 RepID=UPI003790FE57